jgi:hypothetical protein
LNHFSALYAQLPTLRSPAESGVAPQTRPDTAQAAALGFFPIVAAGIAGDVLLCADSTVNCQTTCVFYEAFACCCLKIALFVLANQGQGS